MTGSAKRFLFLVRHPPVAGARVRETLDMILTCAAFDQYVTVLFLDDGVFQLVSPKSHPDETEPPWCSMLQVLELYDLRDLLVETESLRIRGLDGQPLPRFVRPVVEDAVKTLLAQHDRLVVC